MQQSKQSETQLQCAFCLRGFEDDRHPLIFCKGGHISCEQCLFQKADGYDYASFLCPICLGLACKATAISCPWLPPLLVSLRLREQKTASERLGWARQKQQLEEDLSVSRSSEGALRGRLQELQRRKNRFSQNWKKAIQSIVSKRNGQAPWSNQELLSFEKCPEKLINELDRLSLQSKRLQGEIDRLKRQNTELSIKVESFKSQNNALELNWSGTYTKPAETPKKKLRTAYEMDSESTGCEDRGRRHKIEGYLTSNFMQIFKEKMRITEQINLDKRIGAKYKTCKKYFSMKIEELDDKFINHPKCTRLHQDSKAVDLRDPRRKERA